MLAESSMSVLTVSACDVAGVVKIELEEGAADFGLKKGPCTGSDAGSSRSGILAPAVTAAEALAADAASIIDGLTKAGAR